MGKYKDFLKNCEIFMNLTANQLDLIENICKERSFDAGDVIFNENSPGAELWMIIDGEVEILVNPSLVANPGSEPISPSRISIFRRGQSFGEIALVDEGLRTATARIVVEKTVLLEIARQELLKLFNFYPDLGFKVMFNLAIDLSQKIRSADMRIREEVLYRQSGKID